MIGNATELDQLRSDLLKFLVSGDLDGARTTLADATFSPQHTVADLPVNDRRAMSAAATVAEIHFTFGNDAEARKLLRRYADRPERFAVENLSAREQLQLAEYHYSEGSADGTVRAAQLAEQIFRRAETEADLRGMAECRYYLARYSLRQNQHTVVEDHCMRGIELFHRIVTVPDEETALTWHTGRLLRVRGTALWWQQRIVEAAPVLYLSAWILKRTGSRIHVGDALHALGRLLRSQGPARYDEAIHALESAHDYYKDHDLKRARTLTDLARTRLNKALETEEDQEQEELFRKANEHLTMASTLCDEYCKGPDRPKVWLRQQLDTRIWQSWFRQEATGYVEPVQSMRDAREAIDTAALLPETTEHIEAELVLGNCLLDHDPETAAGHLESALESAERLKIPKLIFHARLCLAQLECRRSGNVHQAFQHYEATREIEQSDQVSSFLVKKAAQVRRELDKLAHDYGCLVITKKELLETHVQSGWNRLDVIRTRAEKWAVETAVKQKNGIAAGARALLVADNTVRNVRKRADALEKGLPPEGG